MIMSYLLELLLFFNKKLFSKCPEGKLCGFIPVGEIPSEDPEEIPISLDDGDDSPDWTTLNPLISLRDENHVHNGENDAPPPEVPNVPAEPPLRRSSHTWVIPSHPDNVYGDWTPIKIIWNVEHQTYWKKMVEGSS